jgi:hypothetical protein
MEPVDVYLSRSVNQACGLLSICPSPSNLKQLTLRIMQSDSGSQPSTLIAIAAPRADLAHRRCEILVGVAKRMVTSLQQHLSVLLPDR